MAGGSERDLQCWSSGPSQASYVSFVDKVSCYQADTRKMGWNMDFSDNDFLSPFFSGHVSEELGHSPPPKLPIVTSRPVPSEPEVHFLNCCRISFSCFQPFKVEINSPWKTISAAQGSAALACIGFAASKAILEEESKVSDISVVANGSFHQCLGPKF